MGQAQPKRRTALIVEDDAELRSLTAALLEEEQLDTILSRSANKRHANTFPWRTSGMRPFTPLST
jgi:CheY-like chemotaxis protein